MQHVDKWQHWCRPSVSVLVSPSVEQFEAVVAALVSQAQAGQAQEADIFSIE